MDSPTSITGRVALLTRPEFEWETRTYEVNEAPAVIIRHGRVFMTYSASATTHNNCVGLLTAPADADLLERGSWNKSPEPVFQSSEKNGIHGPGHNSSGTGVDRACGWHAGFRGASAGSAGKVTDGRSQLIYN